MMRTPPAPSLLRSWPLRSLLAAAVMTAKKTDDAHRRRRRSRTRRSYTGDGAIDQVIDAALAADDIALAGLPDTRMSPARRTRPRRPATHRAAARRRPRARSWRCCPSLRAATAAGCGPSRCPTPSGCDLPEGPESLGAVARAVRDPADIRRRVRRHGDGDRSRTGLHADGQPMGVALHLKNGRVVWIEATAEPARADGPERSSRSSFDPNVSASRHAASQVASGSSAYGDRHAQPRLA